MRLRTGLLACVVWGAMLVCGGARLLAHDGPEHAIEELTAEMKENGRTATLLYQRSTEYRELGKLELVANDLAEALTLDPNSTVITIELAYVWLAQGKLEGSLTIVENALSKSNSGHAGLRMARARIEAARGHHAKALADCEAAIKEGRPQLDWYLFRSQLHGRLGRLDLCVRGLKEGFDKTGSAVLKVEWVQALIDAGKFREALKQIGPELAETRWRSSWLIRRARARFGLGQTESARQDLHQAIEELNLRISPRQPDVMLLADRGFAYALLREWQKARADFDAAQSLKADPLILRRLKELLIPPRSGASSGQSPLEGH